MANVTTLAKGGTSGSAVGALPIALVKHEIDIADAVAAGLTTTGYVVVVNLPADTYFRLLQAEVVTSLSLGANGRLDVGDATDDDEFVSNATTYTAGTNLTLIKGDYTGGDVVTATDSLRLKVAGDSLASGTGVIRFVWLQGDTSVNTPASTT